ncbi:acyltransferase [Intrasporangium sp.]|uniref:acyltransferase family protein n=1 Tax=Intrasporangium sp. TaxID=1925024 RepID=UPI00336539A9
MKVLPQAVPQSGRRPDVVARPRRAWADHLKVVLVAGVIVAHATMAWTGMDTWVFNETPVREPLLTVLLLIAAIAALFGMALFFLVAGYFTPRSLQRKGFTRFVADRALRLLVPMAAFVVLLSPPIEYVDPQNAGWTGGFWEFVPHIWWPPVPGPTWFLGVLFGFSLLYALLRSVRKGLEAGRPLRLAQLLMGAVAVAVAAFLIMIQAPLGVEVWHLALAQLPGWVAGFTIGVLAAEHAWLPLDRDLARRIRVVAWLSLVAGVVLMIFSEVTGMGIEPFLGGGTWQSAVLASIQAVMVMTVPLWVVDLFWRRFDQQPGRFGRALGRSAFAAFLVHQSVLVALVLGVRLLHWPPEAAYVTASTLAVTMSFALGWLLTRVPGVSRIV